MIRAHMQTPLWANRPGPRRAIRTVDLFATVLAWLGEPIPAGIDGELVWSPDSPGGRNVPGRAAWDPGMASAAPAS
jgi:hypothetical protein